MNVTFRERKMVKKLLWALALLSCLAVFSGCTMFGNGDIAEYHKISGSLVSQDEPGTVTELHSATVQALKNLELPISFNAKDNLVAVMETFMSDGKAVSILIEFRSADVSKITIGGEERIEEEKLRGIIDEIRRNMEVI
jgi:hypothetical protein